MGKTIKNEDSKILTVEAFKYEDLKQFKTTSAKVRYLASLGFERTEISKIVNIRYQHVRNILTQELKKK